MRKWEDWNVTLKNRYVTSRHFLMRQAPSKSRFLFLGIYGVNKTTIKEHTSHAGGNVPATAFVLHLSPCRMAYFHNLPGSSFLFRPSSNAARVRHCRTCTVCVICVSFVLNLIMDIHMKMDHQGCFVFPLPVSVASYQLNSDKNESESPVSANSAWSVQTISFSSFSQRFS